MKLIYLVIFEGEFKAYKTEHRARQTLAILGKKAELKIIPVIDHYED